MTLADRDWHPFGLADEEYAEPDRNGIRWLHLGRGTGPKDARPKDQAGRWLRNAMIALGLLAAAAAVVSFTAQYRMVYVAKGTAAVAALEAAIPDVSAVVFAALGIALALHGRRAVGPRVLNVAAVATSIGMNYLAAGSGWRDAAIWVMPSVAYAVASDRVIAVVRAHALAQQRQLREALADDEATPLAIVGALLLWLLRLVLAPGSTLSGFRGWVVEEVRVAPGRTAPRDGRARNVAARPVIPAPGGVAATAPQKARGRRSGIRRESKTARFLALVQERYGELAGIDPVKVSQICTELAPHVDLDIGAARSTLLPRVRQAIEAAQEGGKS